MTRARVAGAEAGPVVITGASGHVGRALQARLRDLPNEVRPVGRRDRLEQALDGATAVIHLAGTLQAKDEPSYEDANVATVRHTVATVTNDWSGRLVFLSCVGADPSSANAYLRTKGVAEQLVLGAGRAPVVIRSTFVYGPPWDPGPSAEQFIAAGRRAVPVVGDGHQLWAPVFVDDVVEALTRTALNAGIAPGIYELGGPEVISVRTFVAALTRGQAVHEGRRARPVARVVPHSGPELSPVLAEVLAADSLPAAPFIADALDLELTSLREVYP